MKFPTRFFEPSSETAATAFGMAFTGAIAVRDASAAGDVAGSAALIGGGGGGRRVCNAMPCHAMRERPEVPRADQSGID